MPSIQINATTTNAQTGQHATLFNPFSPFLRLNVDYVLSEDLVEAPNLSIGVVLEMIDFRTNQVFFYDAGLHVHPAGMAAQAYYYDINPSNTAGMDWVKGDIFGFRGAVDVSSATGFIDAIAVSEIKWFRLEDIGEL